MPGSRPGRTRWTPRGPGIVMHGLDPCIPARWPRHKPRMVRLLSSPDLASWMPGSRPGKTPSRAVLPGRGGAEHRAVGLEVEEGRTVDAVEPSDVEHRSLPGDERHDRRPDRVRPHRRAEGEGRLGHAVSTWTLA